MGSIWQSQNRGELGYAHWPQLGSQIHCPIGNQIWGPLGKEGVCPNFALTVGKFVFSNSGNFKAKQIRQSPGLALNAMHSGNDWGPIPVLTGTDPPKPELWDESTLLSPSQNFGEDSISLPLIYALTESLASLLANCHGWLLYP